MQAVIDGEYNLV